MVAAIFPVSAAAETVGSATSVKVFGITLDADTPYYINGASGAQGTTSKTAPEGGWNAYFKDGVLTLDGLNITSSGYQQMISAYGSLKIVLKEGTTNTITNNRAFAYGIWVENGTLEITGKGTLSVTASGSTIYILRTDNTKYAVIDNFSESNLIIDGSTVNLYGATLYIRHDSIIVRGGAKLATDNVIWAAKDVVIENGEISAAGYTGYDSLISAIREFKIIKGALNIDGVNGYCSGIASSKISINGGTVKINCYGNALDPAPIFGNGYEYAWRADKTANFSTDDFDESKITGSYVEIVGAPEVTYYPANCFEKGSAPSTLGVCVSLDITGFNADNNFVKAEISSDGEIFTELTKGEDYEAINGSIIVNLKKNYLNTLAVGEYTLRVYMKDVPFGYVDANFAVTAESANKPTTGTVHNIISAGSSSEENPNTGAEGVLLKSVAAVLVISGVIIAVEKRRK